MIQKEPRCERGSKSQSSVQERIVTERKCTQCGVSKPIEDFRIKGAYRLLQCKTCEAESQRRRYAANPEKYKAYAREQSKTPAGRITQKKYATSKHGKKYRKEYQRFYSLHRWHERPEERAKIQARAAVYHAVRAGYLKKPEKCERCGIPCKRLEAHHHDYQQHNWLNVQWLCNPCHKEADQEYIWDFQI